MKLIINDETRLLEFFASDDLIDRHSISAVDPERRKQLLRHLEWYRSLARPAEPEPAPAPWKDQEVRQLRALGYVE